MAQKRKYNMRWSDIYSLGLLPAILMWGLSPFLDEKAILIASIILGGGWIVFSYFYIYLFKRCGIIGWITGWAMLLSGLIRSILYQTGIMQSPLILFEAPCIALLSYLFEKHDIRPHSCYEYKMRRGIMQEQYILGDFSQYEAHYIVRLVLTGALLSAGLSWGLFLYGIDIESRAGTYFYFYFPAGLGLAIILFESIRRLLIQHLIEKYEKKSKYHSAQSDKELDFMEFFFTEIRIMVIGDEKIFLTENNGNRNKFKFNYYAGLDLPIHHRTTYCTTLGEESQKARQIVRDELGIENPDLRHVCTTIAQKPWQQIGHYILFLPHDSLSKLNRYPGRWYTVNEIAHLFHSDKLHPLFKELYARLYTIVDTARTYHSNGKRRYAIRGYKPAFSLHRIDQMNIVFDDPIWLYVSRHNEDHLLYRIDTWIRKLFSQKDSSNNRDA